MQIESWVRFSFYCSLGLIFFPACALVVACVVVFWLELRLFFHFG